MGKLYGPYLHGLRWRVQERVDGRATYRMFDTFEEANALVMANMKPDAPKQNRGRGASWIYFIQCQCIGSFVKIGYAKDTSKRLVDLQMGCPYELVLIAEFRTPQPALLEAELHDRFQHLAERGEWFRPGDDLMQLISTIPSRAQMIQSMLRAPADTSTRSTGTLDEDLFSVHPN